MENFVLKLVELVTKVKMSLKLRKIRNPPLIVPPFKVDTLEDLLDLAWRSQENEYFDWFTLWKLIPSLTKLSNMIGMNDLKSKITDQIIYHIQGLHKKQGRVKPNKNLHTVIYGPPGTGKTTVAKIIAEIYCNLGILSSGHVIIAGKEDLIGKWIGHTESKTVALLQRAMGGVLFIDEVYSLGHSKGNIDSFSKSIIDILNRYLSERHSDFICIIAGYKREIENHFFSINRGLQRRFPIRYQIDEYSPKELYLIFKKFVREMGWEMTSQNFLKLFEKNAEIFSFYGGDMKILFDCCEDIHSRRVFGTKDKKRLLTKEDLKNGIKVFSKTRTVKDQDIVSRYIS